MTSSHSPTTSSVPLEHHGSPRHSTHPFSTSPDQLKHPQLQLKIGSTSKTAITTHPLAQTPVTASNPPFPSPLPLVNLSAPNIDSLRSHLIHRRSSFPPSSSVTTPGANSFPWKIGGTPTAETYDFGTLPKDSLANFGSHLAGMEHGPVPGRSGLTPVSGFWDSLFNFDNESRATPSKGLVVHSSLVDSDNPFNVSIPMARAKSDPSNQPQSSTQTQLQSQQLQQQQQQPQTIPSLSSTTISSFNSSSSIAGSSSHLHSTMAGRVAQLGSEMVYQTMLGSIVEVEGVGQVNAARVLMEIWKRGGGDVVTAQSLWPSIIMSLAFATEQGPGMRIPTPSAHAASALQNLYNLTLRPCEPSIFSGLLSTYIATMTPTSTRPTGLTGSPGHSLPFTNASANNHNSHPGLFRSHQTAAFHHPHVQQQQQPQMQLQSSQSQHQQPVANLFSVGAQVYGASTPTKNLEDQELAQWTTLTPGAEWSDIPTLAANYTPRGSISSSGPSALPQTLDVLDSGGSTSRPGSRGEDQIRELNDLLAQMEEEQEHGPDPLTLAVEATQRNDLDSEPVTLTVGEISQSKDGSGSINRNITSGSAIITGQIPTTSTSDSAQSPPDRSTVLKRKASSAGEASDVVPLAMSVTPVSMASPFVTANSAHSNSSAQTSFSSASSVSAIVPSSSVTNQSTTGVVPSQSSGAVVGGGGGKGRAPPPTQLALPTAPFIPPPPMCMFFSPSFRDLQKGKVAVWKGDIEVRGRGGGTFNILIIGEEGSGNLWQSHTWPERLIYPPQHVPVESCTSTMLPVSMLAREGLLPVAMGMVLCNDGNISNFVRMVQGLHAEGVAFHLPLTGAPLPIIVLPAKFDSNDPLQRLGIAFMSKNGALPTGSTSNTATHTAQSNIPTLPSEKKGTGDVPPPGSQARKRRRKTVDGGVTARGAEDDAGNIVAEKKGTTMGRKSNTSRTKPELVTQ